MDQIENLDDDFSIAIVGMAGRFPQANDIGEFWRNIAEGRECVKRTAPEELELSNKSTGVALNQKFVPVSAKLEGSDLFDASFFGISPNDARLIDPQHRVFLESAYHALEHAGYGKSSDRISVGVYAGCSVNSYLLTHVALQGVDALAEVMEVAIASQADFLTSRVAYHLDLQGPAVTVQTACSTSLVAVHLACQALLAGECDLALAGGVSVTVGGELGYMYQEEGILSPDGRCRAFDSDAAGTFKGDGVGVVVLKPLNKARHDGDTIHAVIRASAVCNDGFGKSTFTSPSARGQARAISEAIAAAGIHKEDISYIEAHGTGTKLGDPIEIEGLRQVFGASGNRCGLGSVKTNIGHLDAAAGIAGLIKVVQALKHKQLPPSLHFKRENPFASFSNTSLYIQRTLEDWHPSEVGRIAGVSSFGLGGTNAHVIVSDEDANLIARKESHPPATPDKLALFLLSAKTPSALAHVVSQCLDHLRQSSVDIAASAYTYCFGKQHFQYRSWLVCDTQGRVLKAPIATDLEQGQVPVPGSASRDCSVVFLFPGHGGQYPGMVKELYADDAIFRRELNRCAEFLLPHIEIDIRHAVLSTDSNERDVLFDIQYAQPILFSVEYCLGRRLIEWGITPAAMLGHSLGEYVAACLSGVFTLEDALTLVAIRGKLLASSAAGRMLAVEVGEAELTGLLCEGTWLSGVNSDSSCTVSGTPQGIAIFQTLLDASNLNYQELDAAHPYHSPLLDSTRAEFISALSKIVISPPQIPLASNVTGDWLAAASDLGPNYWFDHLTKPVRFRDGALKCFELHRPIFLEVGPGHTLGNFIMNCRAGGSPEKATTVINTLPHARNKSSSAAALFAAVGALWKAGANVDWMAVYSDRSHRRVPTPLYPFERKRHWILPVRSVSLKPPTKVESNDSLPPIASRPIATSALSQDPVIEVDRALLSSQYEGPTSEAEFYLLSLWERLLGLKGIGVTDNFFELGVWWSNLNRHNDRFLQT